MSKRLLDIITKTDETISDMGKKHTFRFRIHSLRHHYEVGRHATIEGLVNFAKHYDLALDSYTVEDKDEDAEVDLEELMEAWERGERPLDLSMF